MKDPLRYFVAEGFLALFSYPDPDNFDNLRGTYRPTKYVNHLIRKGEHDGKACLIVDNTAYIINKDFFENYATPAQSEKDASNKIDEWVKDIDAAHIAFNKQIKGLANA